MSTKLTAPQLRMLRRILRDGPMRSPYTSNRASVSLLSAWHRTAKALAKKGYITVERSGGMYVAKKVPGVETILRLGL